MAVRPVLTLPGDHEFLRRRCAPVKRMDERVQGAIQDLLDSWAANAAYGIAAPQIGLLDRIIVVKLHDDEEPFAIVNPKILRAEGEIADYDGCLSIPGIYATTRRAARITVTGKDALGKPLRMVLEDFPARIVQHEIDHLDGVLFIDRLDSPDSLYTLEKKDEEYHAVPLAPDVAEALLGFQRPLPETALRWESPPAESRPAVQAGQEDSARQNQ